MGNVNLSGMNKAEVLAKLYNAAKPLGLGFLHYRSESMSVEEAQKILDEGETYFDYLRGRVMKIDLRTDELYTNLYNRDNGENAAERVLGVEYHDT